MPTPTFPISGILDQTPDPFQKDSRLQIRRNNTKGRIEIVTSRDRGKNYKVLLPEPSSSTAIGCVPTLIEGGGVEWRAPSMGGSTSGTTSALGVRYAEFLFPGQLQLNRSFGGYFVPPGESLKCIGIQLSAFVSSAATDIKVDIINISGDEQGRIATLAVGVEYAQTIFSSPLLMNSGFRCRLKIKQIGSVDQPGEFLCARLLLAPR